MKLKVLVKFQDINTRKIYSPDDVIEISNEDRSAKLVERKLCAVEVEGEPDAKKVLFNNVEYDLKVAKEALKSIGQAVANNAGVDAVVKKLTELTEEQSQAIAEFLSE